ncbi:hypothetical protein GCM10022419_072210 [Nonomuraea rosea]|uniref:Secreted protein n=1 Tax=Nonomuraea rosea TaxID=638574 RepID=A0ABP6YDF8_9ACTN
MEIAFLRSSGVGGSACAVRVLAAAVSELVVRANASIAAAPNLSLGFTLWLLRGVWSGRAPAGWGCPQVDTRAGECGTQQLPITSRYGPVFQGFCWFFGSDIRKEAFQ